MTTAAEVLAGGVAAAYSPGQHANLTQTVDGSLRVAVTAGGGGGGGNAAASATGAAVPASADYLGYSNAGGTLVGVSPTNPLPVTSTPSGTQTITGTVSIAGTSTITGTVGQATVVPSAGTASAITTGGTATILATGPWKGGFVQNPLSASDQNIATAETAYINLVTTATANGRGTNCLLQPGQSFTLPPVSSGVTLSAIAATTGHAFSLELFV